jgi:hypothetical protein
MKIMFEHVLGGTVGGVVATILCIFFAEVLWKRIIVPWYEERVYKDSKIEGTWKGMVAGGKVQTPDIVELRRIGHNVSGTMHVSGHRAGIYMLEGSFKNLILSVTYAAIDRTQLNRGSITLMLKENGAQLIGKCVHYDGHLMSIAAQDYELKR